jgi:hypothetical protein
MKSATYHGAKISCLIFALIVGSIPLTLAELPPSVYQQWRQAAPESLAIKVLSVKQTVQNEPNEKRVGVAVQAQVLTVERSQSGIKPGAIITINYVHHEYDRTLAGPSQVPILRAGQECSAYLKKDENRASYSPAAGGHSFGND